MAAFQRIESIHDLTNVLIVDVGGEPSDALHELAARFHPRAECVPASGKAVERAVGTPADVVFVGPSGSEHTDAKRIFCHRLREAGHRGVVVLLAAEVESMGGTGGVTGEGFDHYLMLPYDHARLEDAINWAILNRRRKNKYMIQFDDNPDAFFTVDAGGRVFDINQWGTVGTGLTPRKIVVGEVNIADLGTLQCFAEVVRPLIAEANANRTFMQSVYEEDRIFQVKTRIHNTPMIGLVATVVKTDITETIYARSMDILLHSVTLLSERDNYTAGHSSRVYHYCKLISEAMGITEDKRLMRDLYFAALLHDIGKIGVRDSILLKEGKLDPEEFSLLAEHPEKGYRALQQYPFLRGSTEYVLFHHERPDGQGYPRSLVSGSIPLGASIIAVADGFDAMTTTRPYRQRLSYDRAVAEIRANMGTQFDRDVARAFLSTVNSSAMDEVRRQSSASLATLSRELLSALG
jgi:HD-GYP domain-containing protein (c-di-GMP phosphodiesterase class II)